VLLNLTMRSTTLKFSADAHTNEEEHRQEDNDGAGVGGVLMGAWALGECNKKPAPARTPARA